MLNSYCDRRNFDSVNQPNPNMHQSSFSACRVPLGMSYFMLKGTSPNKPKSSSVLTYPITLNHFYKFYDLATYALQLSYNDRGFRFKYYETSDYYGRNYGDYVSFVDIKLRKYL
jgi:hypothetical protein